jgi:alkanesulfonate monooxygenase SsuD/methylene tetrahydromethanopterin reductase-like flavin-dependent oxidoreductase (luciferase family)
MQFGLFFFDTVDMPDAGHGGTEPINRRYGQADFVKHYHDLVSIARLADDLDYDSLWLAEHHFQHEGYEVVPNIILMSAFLAERTRRLKFGGMFNVVPQWHPLRLAEDYALADVMTGGRIILGVGRGTVPRESQSLGARMGWNDDADDRYNRELFEEQIAIMKLAWSNERFSFHGKHYQLPPTGIDDRGRTVETLTLVPRPLTTPVEIWQPVTSPGTFRYAAQQRHKAVFWNQNRTLLKKNWALYGELVEQLHGVRLRPGEDRLLVTNVVLGDSLEEAMERARPGHDEFFRFLAPYGRSRNYLDENGKNWEWGRMPTLEDSIDQGAWIVGTPETVSRELIELKQALGIEYLVLFPHFPGMVADDVARLIERFAQEVRPAVRDAGPADQSSQLVAAAPAT